MGNFFSEADNFTLEKKIDCLEQVISNLCTRFDQFEEILLQMKNVLDNNKQEISNELLNQELIDEPSDDVIVLPYEDASLSDVSFIKEGFCGQPEGSGFDDAGITDEKGIRSLYDIKLIDSTHACFIPLKEKISRFKNNSSSLLEPVCDVEGDIVECQSFDANYGQLVLVDGNYWKVTKKCLITCKND